MTAAAEIRKPEGAAFARNIVLAMVIVGVLAFAAFLVLSAFANDLRKPDASGEHAQSKGAVGFAGLVALLRAEGRPVHLHRGKLSELGDQQTLLVLTPPPGKETDPDHLFDTFSDTLVVLPKWRTAPDDKGEGWVKRAGVADPENVAKALSAFGVAIKAQSRDAGGFVTLKPADASPFDFKTRPNLPIRQLQTISGDDVLPVIVDEGGAIVVGRIRWPDNEEYGDEEDGEYVEDAPQELTPMERAQADADAAETEASADASETPGETTADETAPDEDAYYEGRNVYILADPDLLNTQGIADLRVAEAGVDIVHLLAPADDAPITFDLTLHGIERSRNLLRLMLIPPFLPATLCVVFAGVLMGVHAAAGGGVRRKSGRDLALGSATLVENSALLIAQARRERGMGKRYAVMMRAVAAKWAGVPPGLNEQQQTKMLDAISGAARQDANYTQLAEAASTAKTPSALLQAVRRLHKWKQELVRDRRGS